ncbi:MAG: helix-turn-helix domain-containing protein [Lachnospiraceae bacterium]|nr:helix-turn-helix domain-containing protein [Ruminococcus sp.]MCM1275416.1 helix-turn-helix domain-containing protein [Lachnospiraceae bacterium]
MDTIKIGKFLSELRRERELTQEQLGERLGVTNKTVSRWENGNYMPPVEMLIELSKFYGVSINEILSGKRLAAAEMQAAAEENLKTALEQPPFSLEEKKQYYAQKWKKEHWYVFVIPALIALNLIIASAVLEFKAGVFLGCLIPIPARIIAYNKMMAYVEYKAFDVEKKLRGKKS